MKRKLEAIRRGMKLNDLAAIRMRGVDWFSWATAGGSSVVILTNETGVGEILVTQEKAWVLTNAIEAERFREEEVPSDLEVWSAPWENTQLTDLFVQDAANGGVVASDRPVGNERFLPEELIRLKRRLLPEEMDRYRKLGADTARAMTETLQAARPDWTESQLVAEGSRALWTLGIHPTLTLAGGQGRVARFRHPTPTLQPIGDKAMLVFCGRRHGLYANLTRFVYFRQPTREERRLQEASLVVEAAAFRTSQPGNRLGTVFTAIEQAYEQAGFPGETAKHHQGGLTGYLSREVIANGDSKEIIEAGNALAWNPSLKGAKTEDTVLVQSDRIEAITLDPKWPTVSIENRTRPDILVNP